MALNEPFRPLYRETTDTVRDRLLSALPDELSRVEGSFGRDILEVAVVEFTRLWDEMNRYLSYQFPSYAFGQLLDAHAASLGLERSLGSPARTTVRFTGDIGAAVPSNTTVSVPSVDPDAPRAFFETTNTATVFVQSSGYVEVGAVATSAGNFTNQPVGAVTLLETDLVGITGVTNSAPAVGGSDPENDEDLRARLQLAVTAPTGSGTKVDYVRWGLEVPGVAEVTVEPLWDRSGIPPASGNPNGTVRLSVRGPNFAPVDWSVLQEVQKTIDPSRQLIGLLEEGEAWTPIGGTIDWDYTNVQVGRSALRITRTGAGTAAAVLARQMDLSRFGPDDAFYVYLFSPNWGAITGTSYVRFAENATNYFQATLDDFSPESGLTQTRPVSGSGWWLHRIEKDQMTVTGSPSWSAITSSEVAITTTGNATLTLDYWRAESSSGAAGEGRAPIGAAVTVVTPVSRPVNVSASVLADRGYTLTGAPGTTNLSALIEDRLTGFLLTQQPGQIIRVVDIANVIHDTPGVVDFTLTAPAANVTMSMHEYAVLGTLTLGAL